jgi:hypothetical protein
MQSRSVGPNSASAEIIAAQATRSHQAAQGGEFASEQIATSQAVLHATGNVGHDGPDESDFGR